MATYTETKSNLDQMALKATGFHNQTKNLLVQVTNLEAGLQALQTEYAGFITELNSDAAAFPSDPAWIAAKSEKDKIVAEFLTLKTRVTNIKNAIASL